MITQKSNNCWTSSLQLISQSPPKKPPRLTKILNLANNHYNHHHPIYQATPPPPLTTSTTTTTTLLFPTLPVILEKEIHIISSPINIPLKSKNSIIVGNSTVIPQKPKMTMEDIDTTTIISSPILSPINATTTTTNIISSSSTTMIIDNEFINSEFYIDESLPSSLNDNEDYIKDFDNNTSNTTLTTSRSSFGGGTTDSELNFYQIINNECEKIQKKSLNCKKSNAGIKRNNHFDETDNDEEKIFNGATINDCRGSLETVFGLLQVLDDKTNTDL